VGDGKREWGKTNTMKVMFVFVDTVAGLPTSWVPPGVLPFISFHPALAGIIVVGIPLCAGVVLLVADSLVTMVSLTRLWLVILVACSCGIVLSTGVGEVGVFGMEWARQWRKRTTISVVAHVLRCNPSPGKRRPVTAMPALRFLYPNAVRSTAVG